MSAILDLIKSKLNAALDTQKKRIAETLLAPKSVKEDFGKVGRPVTDVAPSENVAEKRQKAQLKVQKMRLKVQQLQQKAAGSNDARGMNAKLSIARTELSLAQQKLASIR